MWSATPLSPSASTSLASHQLQSAWHGASRSWNGIMPASTNLALSQLQSACILYCRIYNPLPDRHWDSFNQLGISLASTNLESYQLQPAWHCASPNYGILPTSTSLALGQHQPAWHPTSFNQLDLASASTSWAPFQLLPTWHCISFNQLGNRPASIQPTQCEGASIRTTQSLTISLPSSPN